MINLQIEREPPTPPPFAPAAPRQFSLRSLLGQIVSPTHSSSSAMGVGHFGRTARGGNPWERPADAQALAPEYVPAGPVLHSPVSSPSSPAAGSRRARPSGFSNDVLSCCTIC